MPDSNRDTELWKRLKNGERSAFEEIYREQIGDLINYGRRYTKDLERIEDGVHDVFVYIWTKRDTLSDTDSIKKYLLVSLRNKLIHSLGKSKNTQLGESDDSIFGAEDSVESRITSEEDQTEKIHLLESVYHVLSKRQKEAIFLKYNNELSYEDICKKMEINYQSARNLISSGLKKLQSELKKRK